MVRRLSVTGSRRLAAAVWAAFCLFGCAGCGGGDQKLGREGESCLRAADCEEELRCIDNRCTAFLLDGDADPAGDGEDAVVDGDVDPVDWEGWFDCCYDVCCGENDCRQSGIETSCTTQCRLSPGLFCPADGDREQSG